MKNTASIFTITLASSYTFFIFGKTPRMENDAYSLERPVLSQNTRKHMKKRNIYSPVPETI